MDLIYVGKPVPVGSALPLPEGWTAENHNEPDTAVAKAKLASGLYTTPVKAPSPKKEG